VTTRVRAFRDADAEAVADLVALCLRTVNNRDYRLEIIERMCAHFVPDRFLELAVKGHQGTLVRVWVRRRILSWT
jgi:hypothetical protein